MKLTKKFTALLLAVLMTLSIPVTASAATYDISVSISQGEDALYATGEYTVTAIIANASKADAESSSEFSFQSTGPAIQISSNKTATLNNDETTYTIRQQAKLTMPAAGTTFSVTAKFGSSSKTVSYTSKQPINSFDFTSEQTDHSYYDASSNTIYADRRSSDSSEEEYFNLAVKNISPATNDDRFYAGKISANANKQPEIREVDTNSFRIFLHKETIGKFELNIGTFSGLASRKCNVQTCIEAKKYTLRCGNYEFKVNPDDYDRQDYMTITQGEDVVINASMEPGEANDDIKYNLFYYNGTTDAALAELYEQKGNSCTLKNGLTPGTYLLKVKNYSKDNGKLKRTLIGEKTIEVTVNKAEYIQEIELLKLDEEGAQIPGSTLNEITLYKDATADTKRTFMLDNCVKCTPKKEQTSGDSYIFTSESPNIATVNETTGLVEAKNKGEAIIWVKSVKNPNAALTSVRVIVKNGTKNISITKEDNSLEIPSGHVQNLIASRTPADADDDVRWYSENSNILAINSQTGEISAKSVSSNTNVKVSVTADSGATDTKTITVVPAVRATGLTLAATAYNANNTESTSSSVSGKTYKDYYLTDAKKQRYFIVTATPASQGECNDAFDWKISYQGGVGITLEEAVEEGIIACEIINPAKCKITPLSRGKYVVTCVATLNPRDIKSTDPTDQITIEMLQTANSISVKDTGTDNNTSGWIDLPIGGTKQITVKTSTKDNDKKADPPTYRIAEGAQYIKITQKPSADGEGVTYTITGLTYGESRSRVIFSSLSQSTGDYAISIYVRNNLNGPNVEVRGVPESYVYTGEEIKCNSLALYANGSSIDSSQYSVKYSDNVNAGTATITLTGKNDYAGSQKTVKFKITPKPFNKTVEFSTIYDCNLSKDNRKAEPVPGVRFNNRGLSRENDFNITYKNNTKAGTGTVIITGKGNYKGTASTTFKIIDTAEFFSIGAIPVQTYTGREIKPVPVVKYKGKTLKLNKDFELSYSNNTASGYATVTVKGIGYFRDSKNTTFQIKPRPAYLKKLKKGKKKFTAKWSKLDDVHGYQIMYARDKKFKKSKKSKFVEDGNATSFVVDKLKRKKTYYVCIRAYKNVDGKKLYGNWSKVKKVKTK